MQLPNLDKVKDPKVRTAIVIAESAWNNGTPFSRAIIEASKASGADINHVVEYMLQLID